MYPNSDHHQQEINPRPFLSPGMKHSTMFTKVGTQGLTFNSKSQANLHINSNISLKKNQMSKSIIIKKQVNEIDSFIKEVRQKMMTFQRTLSDHDREISSIRESKTSSYYSSSDSFFKSDTLSNINSHIAKLTQKQLQKDDLKRLNTIYSQIDSIKSELENTFVKKNELPQLFQKFQQNISKLINNNNITKQISELKNKIKLQSQNLHHYFTQQLSNKIKYLHDSNTSYYKDMNNCIDNIKLNIESLKEQHRPNFITSTLKCYSPVLFKYKQYIQKLPLSNFQQQSQSVLVGQNVYYMDKDEYLLDSNHYYLLDKHNKQIKIDNKHMSLLNRHHLL